MRLTIAFIVLALMLRANYVMSQKLNYTQKKVTLSKLFYELKKQTGYHVLWNEQKLDAEREISVKFKNADLKAVLGHVLKDLPLTYIIIGNTIIIKEQERRPLVVPDTLKLKEYNLRGVEILSNGYQFIPRPQVTGSFTLVDSTQFNRKAGGDLLSRLEGISSGLLFNKNTLNAVFGDVDLSIRGRSTIYANDQPLIVLDNFPINGNLDAVNPNDVASITVLKDAAAAAIWGARAGNGVIVITTKRAKYNEKLNVGFNTNFSFALKPDLDYNPNYMSASDYIDIETFLFNNGKYDQQLNDKVNYPFVSPVVRLLNRQRMGAPASEITKEIEALRGNDMRSEESKYLYRNELAQQYAVSVGGGTKSSNHYFSFGYDKFIYALKGNDKGRATVNTQNTIRPFKNLEMELGLNYVRTNSVADSSLNDLSNTSYLSYSRLKNTDGSPAILGRQYDQQFIDDAHNRGFLDWNYVPVNEIGKSPNIVANDNLRLNGGIKYTIVPGLSAQIKYQYQLVEGNTHAYRGLENYSTRDLINRYSIVTDGRVTGYNIPLDGILYTRNAKSNYNSLRAQGNYQKDWGMGSISAIVGYEISEYVVNAHSNVQYGYNKQTGVATPVDTTTMFDLYPNGSAYLSNGGTYSGRVDRIRSTFANIGYTYNGKYTVSGSARIDASNYFGVKTNQKKVPLWSIGGLWSLSQESFYHIDWLPVLNLRASYGYNGNIDKRITGITTFTYLGTAPFTNLPIATIANVGNPELKWEKIGIANFGLDFTSKNQMISGRIEYFFKNGSDIFGDKTFPSSTGIKTLRGNYSKMQGNGMDVYISTQNLSRKWRWKTDFLFSVAHDKVTDYGVVEPGNIYYVGAESSAPVLNGPVYGIYAYKWAGLDPQNGDPRGYFNGEVSKDYNSIVNRTSLNELEYIGPSRPTIYGGLNNLVSFSNITLGVNFSYKMGYYFRKPSVNYHSMYTFGLGNNMSRDFSNRWQKPGDENKTSIPSMAVYGGDAFRDRFYNSSAITVASGNHIRLQDISVSYDLDRIKLGKMEIKAVQLYCYANNLGVIWKANDFGLDPDEIPYINDHSAAIMPPSFSFGVKVNL